MATYYFVEYDSRTRKLMDAIAAENDPTKRQQLREQYSAAAEQDAQRRELIDAKNVVSELLARDDADDAAEYLYNTIHDASRVQGKDAAKRTAERRRQILRALINFSDRDLLPELRATIDDVINEVLAGR